MGFSFWLVGCPLADGSDITHHLRLWPLMQTFTCPQHGCPARWDSRASKLSGGGRAGPADAGNPMSSLFCSCHIYTLQFCP